MTVSVVVVHVGLSASSDCTTVSVTNGIHELRTEPGMQLVGSVRGGVTKNVPTYVDLKNFDTLKSECILVGVSLV